jgi:hypothetical protein
MSPQREQKKANTHFRLQIFIEGCNRFMLLWSVLCHMTPWGSSFQLAALTVGFW